jgi:threonine dehydratase
VVPSSLGKKNFNIINQLLDDIILVKDEEIIHAMFRIFERMKIVVEPTSAMALAAVLKENNRFSNKNVAVILCGGNVDLTDLPF